MTKQQEAAFKKKADAYFKGQRELPKGRNYLWNSYHARTKQDIENFRRNFDNVFPNAPGAGL